MYKCIPFFRLLEECGVALYCDLHAHSRKHNIFIYGCENRRGEKRLQEQVFPLMLHKNTPDKVIFHYMFINHSVNHMCQRSTIYYLLLINSIIHSFRDLTKWPLISSSKIRCEPTNSRKKYMCLTIVIIISQIYLNWSD